MMTFARHLVITILIFHMAGKRSAAEITYRATLLTTPPTIHSLYVEDIAGTTQVGMAKVVLSGMPNPINHAVMWNAAPGPIIDLHPSGFSSSWATDGSSASQVGRGQKIGPGGGEHALLWYGSSASVVDLHPAGYSSSAANGVSDANQVGYGVESAAGSRRALLWSGSASGVVNLHPPGYASSEATAVQGNRQVGWATATETHAFMWNGTAESATDLHPDGYIFSSANSLDADDQVGAGVAADDPTHSHALLWNGTPESVVDLHPHGFFTSTAIDVSGDVQVGWGSINESSFTGVRALLWRGSADSAVHLHDSLVNVPIPLKRSMAYGVNSEGVVVGLADDFGKTYLIWTPVLVGDYNDDGRVDTADYTVWRDNLGDSNEANINQAGDGIGGVGLADYEIWKLHFDQTLLSPGVPAIAVPEPSAICLLFSMMLAASIGRHRCQQARRELHQAFSSYR